MFDAPVDGLRSKLAEEEYRRTSTVFRNSAAVSELPSTPEIWAAWCENCFSLWLVSGFSESGLFPLVFGSFFLESLDWIWLTRLLMVCSVYREEGWWKDVEYYCETSPLLSIYKHCLGCLVV